jgi:hypothetical protein
MPNRANPQTIVPQLLRSVNYLSHNQEAAGGIPFSLERMAIRGLPVQAGYQHERAISRAGPSKVSVATDQWADNTANSTDRHPQRHPVRVFDNKIFTLSVCSSFRGILWRVISVIRKIK